MAQSLETIRSKIVTSLFGRRIGLSQSTTAQSQNDFLVGPRDIVKEIQDLTTASSGTAIPNAGVSRVTCTGSSQGPVQFLLSAPMPGVEKILMVGSSSTGSFQFLTTAAGASVLGNSAGTTAGVINLIGGVSPSYCRLMGVTTAQWVVVGVSPVSTAVAPTVSFTTST